VEQANEKEGNLVGGRVEIVSHAYLLFGLGEYMEALKYIRQ